MPPARWTAALLSLGVLTSAPATQVDWNGLPFSTNLTSTGQPWDASWVAELGSFTGSFAPTAANTAEWAGAWRAASRSLYQTGTGYFAGSYAYSVNAAPFLPGTRAYIWLFNPQAPLGEWILLTNPAWTWPAGSPFDPFVTNWGSADATVAVVGQLTGPGWTLKSAAVANSALPPLPFADWQSLYFTPAELADATVSGAGADPDKDGASNLSEYAAGTLPRLAASFPPPPAIFLHPENSQLYGAATLFRSTRVTGYTWTAWTSDDLSDWRNNPLTVQQQPWSWTVRRSTPAAADPRGFFRFNLTP